MQFNIFLKCPLFCLSVVFVHSPVMMNSYCLRNMSCNVTADRIAKLNATPESTQFHNIIILDPQHRIASLRWCKVNVDCFLLRTHLCSSKLFILEKRSKVYNSAKLQNNTGFGITFIIMCTAHCLRMSMFPCCVVTSSNRHSAWSDSFGREPLAKFYFGPPQTFYPQAWIIPGIIILHLCEFKIEKLASWFWCILLLLIFDEVKANNLKSFFWLF